MRAPSAVVEVMIAVSILVSAVHAIRPIFPGREALVAAGFGLAKGLTALMSAAGLDLPRSGTVLAARTIAVSRSGSG